MMSSKDPISGNRPDGPKRDFIEIPDFSHPELLRLLRHALALKTEHAERRASGTRREGGQGKAEGQGKAGRPVKPLEGKTIAMIFRKSSTRTRVSFEVGMYQLGGHAVFLSDRDSQMGRGESIPDTARVLSGYVDGIVIRTFSHDEARELACHATVPVVNALTDLLHPCQVVTDVFTAAEEFDPHAPLEEFGAKLDQLRFAWIGDGNNMANSWMNAARCFGFELLLACPEGFDPDPEILRAGREAGARIELVRDPRHAVEGAHAVITDVWSSMGQEAEAEARIEAFRGFQVDEALLAQARSEAILLHCLPAHRGEEVSATVLDGPQSRIFLEAENRLHVQKALLVELLG